MIHGFLIIICCQLIGEAIVYTTGLPAPGTVIGMAILFCGLLIRGRSHPSLDEASNLLVKNLGFFFIPAGAGISVYLWLIAEKWPLLLISTTLSTIVTLVSVAWLFRRFSQDKKQKSN